VRANFIWKPAAASDRSVSIESCFPIAAQLALSKNGTAASTQNIFEII